MSFPRFRAAFLEIRRRFCDLEQFARDDIHALIRTLRRQHDRDKQLKRRVEIQLALCVGIILFSVSRSFAFLSVIICRFYFLLFLLSFLPFRLFWF